MKKFDGMILPVFVCADDGAKGELAPAPSSFMERGTTVGLRMDFIGPGVGRMAGRVTMRATATRTNATNLDLNARATNTIAANASTMCSHRIQRWSWVL